MSEAENKKEETKPENKVLPKLKIDAEENIHSACKSLQKIRKRPLLLMYYPDAVGQMMEDDVIALYERFRKSQFGSTNRVDHLDVLIHTLGGSPDSGYLLAQVIRRFATHVTFLVPYHAASAGTLTTFCGDDILLGAYAYLSPIDVSVDGIPLMSIEYFMDFAVECRRKMEDIFNKGMLSKKHSSVESDLLVEMVKQISALDVGTLYRQRTLTAYYAKLLLSAYMFKDNVRGKELSEKISHTMVFTFPSHQFYMDYHICRNLNLEVSEMDERESDISKGIIKVLDRQTQLGIICKEVQKDYRVPFIYLYTI